MATLSAVNEDTPNDAELWKNVIITVELMGRHDGHFSKFSIIPRNYDRKFVTQIKRLRCRLSTRPEFPDTTASPRFAQHTATLTTSCFCLDHLGIHSQKRTVRSSCRQLELL
ncbi:hypothetical protein PILCRDRAFT_529540 [Piloderma croceum F 1598]|uniref:Uncharacterized protein n=1 Tax=Piloderma croceum (strain F 1598) TaxID=765440 RepID=A0A0C3BSI8_PILCF|nr:hypothetical protein PILCRDRAFT_529540 [Piloderma croceum F 1598]